MDNRITDKKAHPWMKTDHVLMDIGKWQIISTHIWINRINGCMILVNDNWCLQFHQIVHDSV